MKDVPQENMVFRISINESLYDVAAPEFGNAEKEIDEICAQLGHGNPWVWGIVTVTASYHSLSACVTREPVQFDSFSDFKDSVLYDTLYEEAAERLRLVIRAAAASVVDLLEYGKDL